MPQAEKTFEIYRETLRTIPPDLLIESVDRARASWKWGNRLPLPGELKALIDDELRNRTAMLMKAKTAHMKAPVKVQEHKQGTFDPAEIDRILKSIGKRPRYNAV